MAGNAEINGLLAAAKCFDCLPDPILWEAETFLYAYITGAGTDPTVLASESRCLSCLNPQTLFEIKAYLLAVISGGSLDPNAIIAGARCNSCIPDGKRLSVDVYLLSQDPSAPPGLTPNSLAQQANAFRRMSGVTLLEIQVWVLAGAAAVDRTPNALASAAKCFRCIPGGFVPLVTTSLLKDIEDGDGIPGGCTDVPADLVPVIEATYTDGTLTSVDVTLPKVCCEPGDIILYEADAADGTGAVLYDSFAVPVAGGTASYTHTFDTSIVPPTKDYILARQVCGGGLPVSDWSNALTVAQPDCGAATTVITVSGAGTADANGDYLWDQAAYDLTGIPTYTNPVSSYYIEFRNGAQPGVDAEIWNGPNAMYRLETGQCFPCGTWETGNVAPEPCFGDLPVPTVAWGSQGLEEANAWAARVVTNGGARPSLATIRAAGVFLDSLETASIKSKMKALNFFAPDSLTAAITPFIKGPGLDPWTNNGPFVSGDLTVNGLIGDGNGAGGGTKYLNTGCQPTAVWASDNDCGMTVYALDTQNDAVGTSFGVSDAGFNNNANLVVRQGGQHYFECWDVLGGGGGAISFASAGHENGFFSGNRTGSNAMVFYHANSGVAFHAGVTGPNVPEVGGRLAANILVFVVGISGGAPVNFGRGRFSFAALHNGLNATEAEALYNAVQALRTALGGGYV